MPHDVEVEAVAAQHAELADLLDGRSSADWGAPSRCPGWSVADVVLHLAQTDEMALVGALSIMLLHEQLVANPVLAEPLKPTRTVIGDAVQAEPVAEAV